MSRGLGTASVGTCQPTSATYFNQLLWHDFGSAPIVAEDTLCLGAARHTGRSALSEHAGRVQAQGEHIWTPQASATTYALLVTQTLRLCLLQTVCRDAVLAPRI